MGEYKVNDDLTGKIFGRLTVLERVDDYIDPKGNHRPKWKCICSCDDHNIVYAISTNLIYGSTISCGCYKKEQSSIRMKNMMPKNEYDLSGEFGIGYTKDEEPFWFDIEDYEKIKDYYWSYDNNGYLRTSFGSGNDKKFIPFHRFILGEIADGKVVDHLIHPHGKENKIDNRKQNLEVKTVSQNTMNAHLYSNNTSGVSGVTYTKSNKKWQVRIGIDGKRIHLGYFDDYNEAVNVRKQAEEKYFKEYSFDNCQIKGEIK